MRGLASGEKGFERFPAFMKKSFVFLNVYCQSVADEHAPRGPDGPYQFNDRSVPVYLIKRWDGETLVQKLGFTSDVSLGQKQISRALEKAAKKNGPISPPKALKPLLKSQRAAKKALEKKRPGKAWVELAKLVKAGRNPKKFPDGVPRMVEAAEKLMSEIESRARDEIAKAASIEQQTPAQARSALRGILRLYNRVPPLKKAILEALAAIPEE